ncbi:MAG TPA: hypothetical protein VGE89_13855 [Bryobacteraceae bacterium]|jgi:hypothetical protein
MALLMDEAYEGFGFLGWCWVDVTQKAIERKRTGPDEVGWILDGLLWRAIHLDYYSSASLARVCCQAG